jgi:broad specificity phosphatase PhoE
MGLGAREIWGELRTRVRRKSPPLIVYLIRHCATNINAGGTLLSSRDPALSEIGWAQVDPLRSELGAQGGPTRFVSSPARRATDTARALALDPADDTVLVENDLREREIGDWEGLTRDELVRRRTAEKLGVVDLTQDWRGAVGVEDDPEVSQRAFKVVEKWREEGVDRLGIVTHAGVIKSMLYQSLEISASRPFAIRIGLGGFAVLVDYRGVWELQSLYLNPKAAAPAI